MILINLIHGNFMTLLAPAYIFISRYVQKFVKLFHTFLQSRCVYIIMSASHLRVQLVSIQHPINYSFFIAGFFSFRFDSIFCIYFQNLNSILFFVAVELYWFVCCRWAAALCSIVLVCLLQVSGCCALYCTGLSVAGERLRCALQP